ncbi:hypothetical protein F0L17_20810 [Streptomyces sp. TRM43335]|uniref:Uncharacterized protein n=1 Tax=Streptomyces taklimakanensis TaxID=2569853 RepID=A0A6G2BGW8_9ACTN|nr:hypothetical protein [Streptomyces taklimakanensis]MTE21508.1 hypothetical protein [Streptomyces taklimakanensis]
MEFVSGWAAPERAPERTAVAERPGAEESGEHAACVMCGGPTEYPEHARGATLCPVCEWQEAERFSCACS